MAQLPPKVPSNWPDFTHKKMLAPAGQNPPWVDEFLDFSAMKRGSHRRSISDSIAFLEAPVVEECRRTLPHGPGCGGGASAEFDRFDDEQFMSMFNDDASAAAGPANSNPSSPSDHNSLDDEEHSKRAPAGDRQHHGPQAQQLMKREPQDEEAQSSCKLEEHFASCHAAADNGDGQIVDPKRIKRILANRQSAQRSRVRKLQYISELERSVTSLQAEVSVLSPRVAFLDHQRLALNIDNSVLKQRIAALAQDKIFKDAHQEALRREIERLRQVYHDQQHNLKKVDTSSTPPPQSQPPASIHGQPSAEKQQLVN